MSKESTCKKCPKVVIRNNIPVGTVYSSDGYYVCSDCWEKVLEQEKTAKRR